MRSLSQDLKDRRILLELDFGARRSDADIAKRIGLTKESTSYRIRRMLSSGTVRHFHTMLDTTQLGTVAAGSGRWSHSLCPARTFSRSTRRWAATTWSWRCRPRTTM